MVRFKRLFRKINFSWLNSIVILEYEPYIDLNMSLECIWKLNAPDNIQVYAWRLLLYKLQMRDEIAKWEVISGAHIQVCLLYFGLEETHIHLFIACNKALVVWSCILDWICVYRFSTRVAIDDHLLKFDISMRGRRRESNKF